MALVRGGAVSNERYKQCRQYYSEGLTEQQRAAVQACGERCALYRNALAGRDGKKVSQEALARRVHVSRKVIGKLERGEQLPSGAVLLRLADALGIAYGQLLSEAVLSPELARLVVKLQQVNDTAFLAHLEGLLDYLLASYGLSSVDKPERCA